MAKRRGHAENEQSWPREHRDGGTFYIRKLEAAAQLEFQQNAPDAEYVRDPDNGQVIFNRNTGQPVMKRNAARDFRALISFAASLVERVEDIENVLTRELIPSSPALIESLCGEISEYTVEEDAPAAEGDEADPERKKITKTEQELVAVWVINEATKIAQGKHEAEIKNY